MVGEFLLIIFVIGQPPERGAVGGGPPQAPTGGAKSLRRQDSGYDTSGLGLEDQMKLNNGLDYIQNIVGDTISENLVKVFSSYFFNLKNIFNIRKF